MATLSLNGMARGGRVTSKSYGPALGEIGGSFCHGTGSSGKKGGSSACGAGDRREQSEARQAARRVASQEIQALRERLDSTDRLVAEDFKRVGRAVEAGGGLRADLWPQLFSDVSCIALWISSEKIRGGCSVRLCFWFRNQKQSLTLTL